MIERALFRKEKVQVGRLITDRNDDENVVKKQLAAIVDEDCKTHGYTIGSCVNTNTLKVYCAQATHHAYSIEREDDIHGNIIYNIFVTPYDVHEN